jgi:hypothetical protein
MFQSGPAHLHGQFPPQLPFLHLQKVFTMCGLAGFDILLAVRQPSLRVYDQIGMGQEGVALVGQPVCRWQVDAGLVEDDIQKHPQCMK